ncbi:energy transducer TonB [Pedobacter sp. UBA5917]|jgi:hypothetical protein|uniref:energy transducer TonB n=1 Tax=Pedobacter sp. UBA5917 TaxID=1947061 RepID=UPI0025E619CB|nr:energy transducer TonB [Pedobacter sp. UBA5917]
MQGRKNPNNVLHYGISIKINPDISNQVSKMIRILTVITLLLFWKDSSVQKPKDKAIIYPYADDAGLEIPAKFPGGTQKLQIFLSKNLKWPNPDWCGQGKIYVQLVIDKDGSIKSPKILKGIPGGEFLNNEALRVVKLMPKWIPAYELGTRKKIASKVIFPIKFYLTE